MISDDDLAKIQAEQEALMTDTVYVQRITRTADSAGGSSEAWTTVETTIGRLALASGREQVMADRIGAVISHTATLPIGTDINRGDRLQVNGIRYQVESVLTRSKQSALRVLVAEVD